MLGFNKEITLYNGSRPVKLGVTGATTFEECDTLLKAEAERQGLLFNHAGVV